LKWYSRGKMFIMMDYNFVILSRDWFSIQIRWYLPDISKTLDGKKRYPTKGVGVSDSSGGSHVGWVVRTLSLRATRAVSIEVTINEHRHLIFALEPNFSHGGYWMGTS
jgi:hypothetical protein